MKPSTIFRIQRFIRFLLRGVGKLEKEHYLFTLYSLKWTDLTLYVVLVDAGWTPNYLGYIYKYQIYQARRLVDGGRHQYHIRFYSLRGGNKVTGHYEIAPEWDTSAHLSGMDLRTMNKEEIEQLKRELSL